MLVASNNTTLMNVNGRAVISRRVEFVLSELRAAAVSVQHKQYQRTEISAEACYRGMLLFLCCCKACWAEQFWFCNTQVIPSVLANESRAVQITNGSEGSFPDLG